MVSLYLTILLRYLDYITHYPYFQPNYSHFDKDVKLVKPNFNWCFDQLLARVKKTNLT